MANKYNKTPSTDSGRGFMAEERLKVHHCVCTINWNLFDSDYLPFFFAMYETMEQTIIPITNGIAKSSPTSQGALLPGA
jgi:hypothetical protein